MRIKNMRIVSSANFKRELSRYLRETTAEDSPIFVTINGSGSHVLMHIDQHNHLLECENYIEEHGIKLHEEEKRVIENYIAHIQREASRYADISYFAGMKDAIRMMVDMGFIQV